MKMIDNQQKKTKVELLHALLFAQEEKTILSQQFAQEKNLLGNKIEQQAYTIEQHLEKIVRLEEQIQLLQLAHFGSRSEKFAHPHQSSLFDEPQVLPEELPAILEAEVEIQVASCLRIKKGGRKRLPAYLSREEIHHRLPEDQKQCACGCLLTKIGEERTEQLAFIPASAKVLVYVREKWACKTCEDTIKTADLPLQPIPKSIASPSLLAHVLVCKYEDHLPLYRQENILQRIGVDIARSTLSHWVIRCGDLLKPLVELMHQIILGYDISYADETPIQVLKETGRPAESMGQSDELFDGWSP